MFQFSAFGIVFLNVFGIGLVGGSASPIAYSHLQYKMDGNSVGVFKWNPTPGCSWSIGIFDG
jgi:hypothetical protein